MSVQWIPFNSLNIYEALGVPLAYTIVCAPFFLLTRLLILTSTCYPGCSLRNHQRNYHRCFIDHSYNREHQYADKLTVYPLTNSILIILLLIHTIHTYVVGAPVAGRLSDYMVSRWREKRGEWLPEDRLRACFWGGLVMVPMSVLASGFGIQYVPGWPGLALNIVCLFFNGFGVRQSLDYHSSNG